MAVLVILSLILVRNLSVENPGKKQLLLETGVSFLQDFFMGILGEEGKQYVPYLMSTVIYIGIANIAGVFGFTPPTKDMNVTIALALMSIIQCQFRSVDVVTPSLNVAAALVFGDTRFTVTGGLCGRSLRQNE